MAPTKSTSVVRKGNGKLKTPRVAVVEHVITRGTAHNMATVIAPPPPIARVVEDTSSRIVSPDIIEETLSPRPSARLRDLQGIEERRSLIRETTNEIAVLEDRLGYQASIPVKAPARIRTRRRHGHRYENSSSSDTEESDKSRVLFMHQEGKKPFLILHQHYRAVKIKYFKQIFFETFKPEHLTELAHNYRDRGFASTKNKDINIPESNEMIHLLRCFEVYDQTICNFAHPDIAAKLQIALSNYRITPFELALHYSFNTIRDYHYSFMTARIQTGQDDPIV